MYTNFFLVTMYKDMRRVLKISETAAIEDTLDITVMLLLVPYNDNRLTSQDNQQSLSATFDYIKQSSHCL